MSLLCFDLSIVTVKQSFIGSQIVGCPVLLLWFGQVLMIMLNLLIKMTPGFKPFTGLGKKDKNFARAVLTFLFISLLLQHNYQVELLIFPNLAYL